MIWISRCVVLMFVFSTSSAFLLEGLGLGLGGPKQQCCCQPPPPPPPCGGGYDMPPPPPPPSYAVGGYRGGYRNKRSSNLTASSDDALCNSIEIRDIIKQGMNDDVKTSRETISLLLKSQIQGEHVVVCSKSTFGYLASSESDFCSVTNKEGLTCSTFVF